MRVHKYFSNLKLIEKANSVTGTGMAMTMFMQFAIIKRYQLNIRQTEKNKYHLSALKRNRHKVKEFQLYRR